MFYDSLRTELESFGRDWFYSDCCTALFSWVKGGCHYLLTGTEILQESWGGEVGRGEVKGFVIWKAGGFKFKSDPLRFKLPKCWSLIKTLDCTCYGRESASCVYCKIRSSHYVLRVVSSKSCLIGETSASEWWRHSSKACLLSSLFCLVILFTTLFLNHDPLEAKMSPRL